MSDPFLKLVNRYATKGVLVDTNILLLYFVGTVNRDRIERFKRTKTFTTNDYDVLVRLLSVFQKIVTTPNILTEVSSFINQLGEPERSRCYSIFAREVVVLEEVYLATSEIVSERWPFTQYGLTDCGISTLAVGQYLVLTDDLAATRYFQSQGIDTLNFNNIRLLD